MAAFVLTLVPAAAFAATADADADASSYSVTAGQNNGELTISLDFDKEGDTAATNLTGSTLRVELSNTDSALTAKGEHFETTASTTFAKGLLSAEGASLTGCYADETITFSNVPTGNQTVKVYYSVDGQKDNYKELTCTSTSNVVAVTNAASAENSFLDVSTTGYNNLKEVSIAAGNELDIRLNVMDKYNVGCQDTAALGNSTYVWAQKEDTTVTSLVTFANGTGTSIDTTYTTNARLVKLTDDTVNNGDTVKAIFNSPGVYYINAGVATSAPGDGTDMDTVFSGKSLETFATGVKVTVTAPDQTTDKITFDASATNGTIALKDGTEWNYTLTTVENADGTMVYTVTGQAVQENGNPAQYETLNITTNKPNSIQILTNEVATDVNGDFTFKFVTLKNDKSKIVVKESKGDAEATINFDNTKTEANNIVVAKDGGYVLAGNDSKYAPGIDFSQPSIFADAVQFTITDQYGNKLTDNLKDSVFSMGKDTVMILGTGEGSKLEAEDLQLAWDADNGVYTLKYVGGNAAKDLVPGEYKVRVSLDAGDFAEATFNVAKFGTVQDLVIDLTAQNSNVPNKDAITQVDDQVALGETVKASTSYVDENGLKVPVNVICNFNGSAVNDSTLGDNEFVVKSDLGYVGTTITVKAYDDTAKKFVEKVVTVVDGYQDETLAFDPTEGLVDKNNTVNVTVVDQDGNLSKVNGTLDAYIADQSNDEANVDITANENVSGGKGSLVIYADKATTVDVVVVVKAANGELYGKTLTYTVGEKDINADKSVVMTIGSSDYVVDNQLVSGDAAPYVDENWRTMAPVRVLSETFGGTVTYKDNVITIVDGDKTVVMTIGEETYTLNDEEKTMDTAPVIRDNDRAYVPVRFMAEALGYEVTSLQDENGLTAAVVFQK